MLNSIEQYIGKYYSISWVRKNILRQTEDDISKIDKEIAGEQNQLQDLQIAQTAETGDESIDAEQDEQNFESPITDDPEQEQK
jgi:septal ring factor EnvC (AmiA/AmiB activator)